MCKIVTIVLLANELFIDMYEWWCNETFGIVDFNNKCLN